MKKAFTLLLVLVLALNLCACGKSETSEATKDSTVETTEKPKLKAEAIIVNTNGETEETSAKDILKLRKENEAKFNALYDFASVKLTGTIKSISSDTYGKYIQINDKWKVYYVKSWYLESYGDPIDYDFGDALADYLATLNVGDTIEFEGYIASRYSQDSVFTVPHAISVNGGQKLDFTLDNILDYEILKSAGYFPITQENIDNANNAIQQLLEYGEITKDNQAEIEECVKTASSAINKLNKYEMEFLVNYQEYLDFKGQVEALTYSEILEISEPWATRNTGTGKISIHIDFKNKSDYAIKSVIFDWSIYNSVGKEVWRYPCQWDGPYTKGKGLKGKDWWKETTHQCVEPEFGWIETNGIKIVFMDDSVLDISKEAVNYMLKK